MARAGRPVAGFLFPFSEIGRRPPGAVISLCFRQGAIEARRRPNQFAGARERNRPRPLTLPGETGFAPQTSRARESRAALPRFSSKQIVKKETRHGTHRRLSDRARADVTDSCHSLGRFVMSAEIIQFVPRPRRDRGLEREQVAIWSPLPADDLAMDHADTAPCEHAPTIEIACDDDTPA
jgi:hypothetical protein